MQPSVNALHEQIPPDHYDRGFRHNLFQFIWHRRRTSELTKVIPSQLGKVLDVGCHAGFLTERVLKYRQFQQLYGIDISREAIRTAKKRFSRNFPKQTSANSFVVADIHHLPFKSNSMDTVFCFEVLEHVAEPTQVLAEIHRVLKKNGQIFILVPTDNFLFRFIWHLWLIVFPVWQHTHIQSFKANRLVNLVKKNGFKVKQEKRFNLNMLLLIHAEKNNQRVR